MAERPRSMPLFLGPAGYRRRRRRDAARLLPFVGIFLILLPILWAPQDTFRRDTAPDGIYLFVVWVLLILGTALISHSLDAPGDDPDPDADPDGDA